MGFITLAANLLKRGYKPVIKEAERTISYATRTGVQKTFSFDTAGKVKFWNVINPETGKMKVYQNLSDTLSKRVSTVEEFSNYSQKVKTTTITTEKDFNTLRPTKQTVVTEDHITGTSDTKINEGIASAKYKPSQTQTFNRIKYKKAKTMTEAKEYARTHLGIERLDVPDLEIANQVNYSLTKAYNKTGEKINKYFTEVSSANMSDLDVPAVTTFEHDNNNNLKKIILKINTNFIKNLDKRISNQISDLIKHDQISYNQKGTYTINLCAEFRYNDTLNRYFRLYQKGKLTQKGKYDFTILLSQGREEERLLLGKRTFLENYLKEKFNINLKGLSNEEFNSAAKKILTILKRKHNIQFSIKDNIYNTDGATGLDYVILHEMGHVFHLGKTGSNYIDEAHKLNPLEKNLALEISEYAAEDEYEAVAEYIAGILSNDKYSQPVKDMAERILHKRIDLRS